MQRMPPMGESRKEKSRREESSICGNATKDIAKEVEKS